MATEQEQTRWIVERSRVEATVVEALYREYLRRFGLDRHAPDEAQVKAAITRNYLRWSEEEAAPVKEEREGGKLDLENADLERLSDALVEALHLGFEDARARRPLCRTGKELAALICRRWLTADEAALRSAYMVARFHAELSEDTKE